MATMRDKLLTPQEQRDLNAPGMTVGQLEDRNAKRLKKARERKIKEGNIREKLKARVEAYGGEIRAVAWLGRKNAPDVLCLLPERVDGDPLKVVFGNPSTYARHVPASHVFVETKRPGKDATEAQAREHERMRAAGCVVKMIRNEAELDAWLPPL